MRGRYFSGGGAGTMVRDMLHGLARRDESVSDVWNVTVSDGRTDLVSASGRDLRKWRGFQLEY